MTTAELMTVYKGLPLAVKEKAAFAFWFVQGLADAQSTDAAPRATIADPDKQARFRAKLVADIWEPDLRSELVDRIANAAALRWFDMRALTAAIRRAKSLKYDYEKSDGARGKDAIWKTLATWIKGVYAQHGAAWTPTAAAVEPPPARKPTTKIEETEAEPAADDDGTPMSMSERFKLYRQKSDAAE